MPLEDQNPIGEYRWECPYTDCKFFLLQYTSKGFEEKISEHRAYHLQKMKEEREEREKKLREREKEWLPETKDIWTLRDPNGIPVKKNYNKLVLTLYDMIQFEIHKIKIDEDCVIDGYSGEYRL